LTPLHWATKKGYLFVVDYLVNQKVDINAKDNSVESEYFYGLPFIMLQKIVILIILSI